LRGDLEWELELELELQLRAQLELEEELCEQPSLLLADDSPSPHPNEYCICERCERLGGAECPRVSRRRGLPSEPSALTSRGGGSRPEAANLVLKRRDWLGHLPCKSTAVFGLGRFAADAARSAGVALDLCGGVRRDGGCRDIAPICLRGTSASPKRACCNKALPAVSVATPLQFTDGDGCLGQEVELTELP